MVENTTGPAPAVARASGYAAPRARADPHHLTCGVTVSYSVPSASAMEKAERDRGAQVAPSPLSDLIPSPQHRTFQAGAPDVGVLISK